MAAHSVDFVDENNARRVLLALLEKVADAARAQTDKPLREVRTGDREERHIRRACNRPRQQSLYRARRSDQQHALRNAAAQLLELLRILQKLNNFLQLFLGLVRSRDVLKGRLLLLRRKQPRTGFAKAQRFVPARLHLPHQEQAESHQQNERRGVQQDQDPVPAAHFLHLDLNCFILQLLRKVRGSFLENRDVELAIRRANIFALQLVAVRREVHGDFFHVAVVHLGHELAVARLEFAGGLPVCGHQLPEHHAQEHDGDPEQDCLCRGTGIHVNLTLAPSPRGPYPGTLTHLSDSLFRPWPLFRKRLYRQGLLVASHTIRRRQSVTYPYTIRCSPEPKVIRLQRDSTLLRLVQKHHPAQRSWLA